MSAVKQMVLQIALTVIAANGYPMLFLNGWGLLLIPVIVIVANTLPLFYNNGMPTFQLRICAYGNRTLKAFIYSLPFAVLGQYLNYIYLHDSHWVHGAISLALCVAVESVLFWNGMISVYLSSVQLGIRHRAAGILVGFIPIANVVMLEKILAITDKEIAFEQEKHKLEEGRKDQFLCKTKYPILLVHGFLFRDNPYFNYWGRIPKTLQSNGATVYYGEHPSALSIADSAEILADRIRMIVQNSGCEKVNIIAHSKGGLDCRYAMDRLGIAQYVASLTTVNTPHRGCEFADRLLELVPEKVQQKIAKTYNDTLRQLGDPDPDFMAAVHDLTSSHCEKFDAETPVPEGVFCQSIGTLLHSQAKEGFPLNLTYRYVKNYDGPNDGLVGVDSFQWGEKYELLDVKNDRGISHMVII